MKLYSEKRSDLEEQQLHLNVGLNKIAETVEQVEEMQKSLAVKSQELQAKNEAANAKLKQMFKDQQEAEKKKIQSQEIQVKLADQTVKIDEKRKFVMADLALVEPAVLDAQQGILIIPIFGCFSFSDFWAAPKMIQIFNDDNNFELFFSHFVCDNNFSPYLVTLCSCQWYKKEAVVRDSIDGKSASHCKIGFRVDLFAVGRDR